MSSFKFLMANVLCNKVLYDVPKYKTQITAHGKIFAHYFTRGALLH